MRPPSLKSTDFQRALGSRPVSRTAHFVLHVLPRQPHAAVSTEASAPQDGSAEPAGPELSTELTLLEVTHVDDSPSASAERGPHPWRLGLVLPKKQARRSVTRSLIRHQAREALRRHAPDVWAAGVHGPEVDGWVLRLKTPFDRQLFPSAASEALSAAVRAELDALWLRLTRSQA